LFVVQAVPTTSQTVVGDSCPRRGVIPERDRTAQPGRRGERPADELVARLPPRMMTTPSTTPARRPPCMRCMSTSSWRHADPVPARSRSPALQAAEESTRSYRDLSATSTPAHNVMTERKEPRTTILQPNLTVDGKLGGVSFKTTSNRFQRRKVTQNEPSTPKLDPPRVWSLGFEIPGHRPRLSPTGRSWPPARHRKVLRFRARRMPREEGASVLTPRQHRRVLGSTRDHRRTSAMTGREDRSTTARCRQKSPAGSPIEAVETARNRS